MDFKEQLELLLNINAPSGQEEKVEAYVKPLLVKSMDRAWTDTYGNVLAEKVYGDGSGPNIILSAHMDTVKLHPGREVAYEGGVFSSTKGPLGADDRAGIAIILEVIRRMEETTFNGKLKIAFSVQEEIGCVGADKIDVDWITEADLAIVVDRRGRRDIITGNGVPWTFCTRSVGAFFEEIGEEHSWVCTDGGLSDAQVFSDHWVNSVNLSAGYFNEHTHREVVVVEYCLETVDFILNILSAVGDRYEEFEEYTPSRTYKHVETEEELSWRNYPPLVPRYTRLVHEEDLAGTVSAGIYGGLLNISVSGSSEAEVILSETVFQRLVTEYCDHLGYRLVKN